MRQKETYLEMAQVEHLICGSPWSPFYIRKNLVIPNVSWGFLNHEADLLVVSSRRTLTEVEIKRTWSDFMADFKKDHTHYDKKLSHLYYAVPYRMAEKVFHWLYDGEYKGVSWNGSKVNSPSEHNPHGAGLIVYCDWEDKVGGRSCWVNVRAGHMNKQNEYVINDKQERELLRLLGMRVWALKSGIANMQNQAHKDRQKLIEKRQRLIEQREAEKVDYPMLFD